MPEMEPKLSIRAEENNATATAFISTAAPSRTENVECLWWNVPRSTEHRATNSANRVLLKVGRGFLLPGHIACSSPRPWILFINI
jgi:hypothetical protein